MRKLTNSVLVGSAVVAAGLAVAAAPSATRPVLEVESLRPLAVEGRGFHAEERVTVEVVLGISAVRAANPAARRITRATRAGTFRVTLPVALPRCKPFSIHARGSEGTRAVRIFRLQLACESPDNPKG